MKYLTRRGLNGKVQFPARCLTLCVMRSVPHRGSAWVLTLSSSSEPNRSRVVTVAATAWLEPQGLRGRCDPSTDRTAWEWGDRAVATRAVGPGIAVRQKAKDYCPV